MVRTLTDTIATALRCGSHSLHSDTLVNEHAGDEQLTCLSLAVILLFPVIDGRAEEFLNVSCGSLLRETKHTHCTVNLHAANHVDDIAHLAG